MSIGNSVSAWGGSHSLSVDMLAKGNYQGTSLTPDDDGISAPSHYMLFDDMEAIEAIQLILTDEQFEGYLRGCELKYRLRAGKKDSVVKDIAKAMQYGKFRTEGL